MSSEHDKDALQTENAVTLIITSLEQLYRHYIPFFKNGGFFIPNETLYPLETHIQLALKLLDEDQKTFLTQVAWITPKASKDNYQQGIGVSFKESDQSIKKTIETYLKDFMPQPNQGSLILLNHASINPTN